MKSIKNHQFHNIRHDMYFITNILLGVFLINTAGDALDICVVCVIDKNNEHFQLIFFSFLFSCVFFLFSCVFFSFLLFSYVSQYTSENGSFNCVLSVCLARSGIG